MRDKRTDMRPTSAASLAPLELDPKAQLAKVENKWSAKMSLESVNSLVITREKDDKWNCNIHASCAIATDEADTHPKKVHDFAECDAAPRQPEEALEWILSNQVLPIVDEQVEIHIVKWSTIVNGQFSAIQNLIRFSCDVDFSVVDCTFPSGDN